VVPIFYIRTPLLKDTHTTLTRQHGKRWSRSVNVGLSNGQSGAAFGVFAQVTLHGHDVPGELAA
jgi:hypothetical protein